MDKHKWKESSACKDYDFNLFFDKYENDEKLRPAIQKVCDGCPVQRQCFAVGVSQKEWGVWGGIYLENGGISREFNKHRDRENWADTWQKLTMDKGKNDDG
jgi:hypothetical protein